MVAVAGAPRRRGVKWPGVTMHGHVHAMSTLAPDCRSCAISSRSCAARARSCAAVERAGRATAAVPVWRGPVPCGVAAAPAGPRWCAPSTLAVAAQQLRASVVVEVAVLVGVVARLWWRRVGVVAGGPAMLVMVMWARFRATMARHWACQISSVVLIAIMMRTCIDDDRPCRCGRGGPFSEAIIGITAPTLWFG